MLAMISVQSF